MAKDTSFRAKSLDRRAVLRGVAAGALAVGLGTPARPAFAQGGGPAPATLSPQTLQATEAVIPRYEAIARHGGWPYVQPGGQMRAGLRPLPATGDVLHPVTEMLLVLTGEQARFEAELGEALGPDDARRVAFDDEICHERLTLD